MSESAFQRANLQIWRGQGLLVQKFNDHFSAGIPDVLLELPADDDSQVPNHLFPGMWLEHKAISAMPKRPTSNLPKKAHPTPEQMGWMKRWDRLRRPCAVMLGTPHGWAVVPYAAIGKFFDTPHTELRDLFHPGRPTYATVCAEYLRCKRRFS